MAEKKEGEKSFKIEEVSTATGMVIKDKDGNNLGQMEIYLEILNRLDRIEREIV